MPYVGNSILAMHNNNNDPSSCVIKIHHFKTRALIDTGACNSIISSKLISRLPYIKIENSNKASLHGVTGTKLNIRGTATFSFHLGSQYITQNFIVCDNIEHQVILGKDFLIKNEVEINYKTCCIVINGEKIQLDDHTFYTSMVKTAHTISLPPRSEIKCFVKARKQKSKISEKPYLISQIASGKLDDYPGIFVMEGIVNVHSTRKFPILLVNSTNARVTLKRNTFIAEIQEAGEICSIQSDILNEINQQMDPDNQSSTEQNNPLDIPAEYKIPLQNLIKKYDNIFSKSDTDLGRTTLTEMKIELEHDTPVNVYPYKIPLQKREAAENIIQDLLKAGVVRHSNSPYNAPSLILRRPNSNKYRFVNDFREINKITRPLGAPLESIDEILASLGQARFISTLDIKSAYHTIPIRESDRYKTAFSALHYHLEYNVCAFGQLNSGRAFNQFMSQVLSGIKGKYCLNWSDDCICYSQTFQAHLDHLESIFKRFQNAGIKLNLEKCKFLQPSIDYVGYTIDKNGLHPNQNKINAINEIQVPTNLKSVRGFIGVCSFFRKFIYKFSDLAEPLINLTRKNVKFHWTQECQKAFESLKQALMTEPVLAFPDLNKQFHLYTDASDIGIGSVLVQVHDGIPKPVHYFSCSLSKTQRKYPTIERECLGLVRALQHFDYLLADTPIPFIVYTDHAPLQYLLTQKKSNNRKLQTWSVILSAYNCKIQYIRGSKNLLADYFSRYAFKNTQNHVAVINTNKFDVFARPSSNSSSPSEAENINTPTLDIPGDFDIVAAQRADEAINNIINKLSDNTASETTKERFILLENVLYYISTHTTHLDLRLVIPETIRKPIIHHLHDENSHIGTEKTYNLLKQRYYWRNMFQDIADHVSRCVTCNTRQINTNKVPIQNTHIPEFCFDSIAIDTSGPYEETSQGNKYIVSVICLFSSYVEAFSVKDKTAQTIANILLSEIFPRYGMCRHLVSDNGTEYANTVMTDLLSQFNIKHIKITPYNAKANGKIERFHRIMHDLLAKHMFEKSDKEWDKYLPFVLSAIRTSTSKATGYSPHFLLYKQEPLLPIDNILKPRTIYFGDEPHKLDIQRMHIAYNIARKNILKSQEKSLKYHNRNARPNPIDVGSLVYLWNSGKDSKHASTWIPYFTVIAKNSNKSYIIKNVLNNKTRRAHIDHLKKAKVDHWEIPQPDKPIRKARLAYPLSDSDFEKSALHTDTENHADISDFESDSDNTKHRKTQTKQNTTKTPESSDSETTEQISQQYRTTRHGRKITKPKRYQNISAVHVKHAQEKSHTRNHDNHHPDTKTNIQQRGEQSISTSPDVSNKNHDQMRRAIHSQKTRILSDLLSLLEVLQK